MSHVTKGLFPIVETPHRENFPKDIFPCENFHKVKILIRKLPKEKFSKGQLWYNLLIVQFPKY